MFEGKTVAQHEESMKKQGFSTLAFRKSKGILRLPIHSRMKLTPENLAFAHRYYDLIRTWVLDNERHSRQLGPDAIRMQKSLDVFASQYDAISKSKAEL